ncbi:MAG: DUF5686 family protein [Bacteroidales bacterium]|nr:DUF5686 family protein [Bacteroidales bacterium]
MRIIQNRLLSLLAFLIISIVSASGQTVVKGIVKDSITNEPLSFVAVYLKGTSDGMNTDEYGQFNIKSNVSTAKEVVISFLGYKTQNIAIRPGRTNVVNVMLSPSTTLLAEIIVKPEKEHYTKKNNPAVEFVKKVIATRDINDPKNHPNFHYEQYEKLSLALNNFTEEKLKNGIFKSFKFMKDYVDTSSISGKPILNISMREELTDYYYQKEPKTEKRIMKASKHAGMDEILAQESMQVFFKEIFKEIDLFQNDIPLFLNRFVSPLSEGGTNFYKYYLEDTVMVDGEKCMNLAFAPFNAESFGFVGNLYITLDSTNFVKKVELTVPKSINLNYVENMTIAQEYNRMPDGTRLITHDDIVVEFQLMPNTDGLYARRSVYYKNHDFSQPPMADLFKKEEKIIEEDNSFNRSDEYWAENRFVPIKEKEDGVAALMRKLRSYPAFYYTEKVIGILVAGYIQTAEKNSKIDLGPMNTTLSGNTVEGLRMRVGGTTTAYLNKHLFGSGYVAYGTKDGIFKYNGQLEYSFRKKKEHPNEFPIHSIKGSYSYDLNQLGQHYIFTNKDNVFLALKRKKDVMNTYLRKAEVTYKREHYFGFSYELSATHLTEYASSYLPFISSTDGTPIHDYSMGEMSLSLRYAPNEKFYQMRNQRVPITLDAPVFTLTHTAAKKGILGTDYDFNLTEFGFQKQLWLSYFGYTKIKAKAGKVWNKVPFPLLTIPNANLSYTIQSESFAMMNAMEFMTDQYASLGVVYHANGYFFNRIPLLKWLKWREVLSFHGIYGSLSDKNNPRLNSGLYTFPTTSYTLGKEPYMEAGVGIENVFKILRVDYIWRLNYLDNPNIDKRGIRIALEFKF